MLGAVIGHKIVKKDESVELKGWIDARFENLSTKPVFIFNRKYEPKDIFFAGVGNLPVYGTVEIEFDPEETQKKVLVTYGTEKDCI